MRVLVLGAYGFIGSAIAHELVARGHQITGLGRDISYGRRILPHLHWITADLSQMTTADCWADLLTNVDAVVNASGLLQRGQGGTVETVQLHAVRALIQACEAAQIRRFVQISAAGADVQASSNFMRTKAQADALIEESSVSSLVIRPGLVIGRNSYGGSELIRAAAAVPFSFQFQFESPIHCIALTDVTDAVARALNPSRPCDGRFDLVEPQPRSLESIIAKHRDWLGLPKARWTISIPDWLLRAMSRTADLLGYFGWRSPLRSNGLLALEAGVSGNPAESVSLLRREPVSLETALARNPAGKQDRLHARLALTLPVMLATLFVMWAASGVATLLQVEKAAAIMRPSGISEQLAHAIAVGGGWLDIVLAVALLWRATARAALMAMIALTLVAYLIAGTALLPGLWLDPLAPFAKALPATMLALVAYWTIESR